MKMWKTIRWADCQRRNAQHCTNEDRCSKLKINEISVKYLNNLDVPKC